MKYLKKPIFQKDVYFHLLNSNWKKLIVVIFIIYFLSNILFALIYTFIPSSINGETPSFETAFFFSVQTMSTIGYGSLGPTGTLSNILVLMESFFGLVTVAIITGIVFAKLSRPNAKIRFSKNIILANYDGTSSLFLRIGNTRKNDIVEAKVHLTVLFNDVTIEGEKVRRIKPLQLVRNYSPFFRLTWLIIHQIDENSPLFNMSEMGEKLDGFMLTVTGHDGTYSTTIYDQHFYKVDELVKNRYFKDIMIEGSDGEFSINYDDFDSLK